MILSRITRNTIHTFKHRHRHIRLDSTRESSSIRVTHSHSHSPHSHRCRTQYTMASSDPHAATLSAPTFPAALLSPLIDMGFSPTLCHRALTATGGRSVDSALEWIEEQQNQPPSQQETNNNTTDTISTEPAPATVAGGETPTPVTSNSSSPSSSSLLSYPAGTPLKLVFLVRGDLGMRTGKIAAQVGHAAVGTVLSIQRSEARSRPSPSAGVDGALLRQWLRDGQAKVVLAIPNEAEMLRLEGVARDAGLHTHIIADAGRTQVEAGSQTVLAIGPGPSPAIDKVTGHLKLL